MTTHIARHPLAAVRVGFGNRLEDGAATLRTLAWRLDAWFAQRRRAEDDRDALVRMSDRELRDIGVDRASIAPIVDGMWLRDPR